MLIDKINIQKIISRFNNHGVNMRYKNVIQYTKGAKNVIKNGTYLAQKKMRIIRSINQENIYLQVVIKEVT